MLRTFSTAGLFRPQVGGSARAIGGASFYGAAWWRRYIEIEKDADFVRFVYKRLDLPS